MTFEFLVPTPAGEVTFRVVASDLEAAHAIVLRKLRVVGPLLRLDDGRAPTVHLLLSPSERRGAA